MKRSLLLCLLALLVVSCGGSGSNDFDGDGTVDTVDCAPADPNIHPAATELCSDGIDNDCNGLVDCADGDCVRIGECDSGDDDDSAGDDDDDSAGDDDDSAGDDDDSAGDDDDSAANAPCTDLNCDGYPDLVISNSSGSSSIFWGTASGHSAANQTLLATSGARRHLIYDLNADGHLDIVFAEATPNTQIYWGSTSGFPSATQLLADSGQAFDAEDLNGDGFIDLVVAISYSGNFQFDTDSYIYWGSAAGYSTTNRTGLPTLGASCVEIADLDADSYPDIIFCNERDNQANPQGHIDSYIYWGSSAGYSASARTGLPTHTALYVSVADLDGDDSLDILFSNANTQQPSDYTTDSFIYWGDASGYSATNRTGLPTQGAHDTTIADVNEDSFLDIVISNFRDDNGWQTDSYIYWGSSSGTFETTNRTALPTIGSASNAVGDVNQDGYLDVVFTNHYDNGSPGNFDTYIYWGSINGFSTGGSGVSSLPASAALDVTIVGG